VERLQRQQQEKGLFLGKHSGHLAFSCAVNTFVRPSLFPVIQVSLCFLHAFEALSF
jgi:hypothetical protein